MEVLGLKGNPSHVFKTVSKYEAVKKTDYFKFTIVRNPLDRLVSCWMQKTQVKWHQPFGKYGIYYKILFREFIDIICDIPDAESDQHWRSQHYDLLIDGVPVPDYIGHVESMSYDWHIIQLYASKKGLTLPDIRHENKTNHFPYPFYYTPNMRDKVRERYSDDLKLFGYDT